MLNKKSNFMSKTLKLSIITSFVGLWLTSYLSNKYQIRIRYMDQELEENETILEICICFMLSRVSRE